MQQNCLFGVFVRSLDIYHSEEVGMFTWIKTQKTPARGLKSPVGKQVVLGALVLFLTIAGDPVLAQSDSDSVIDRIPASATAVVKDQGSTLFLNQVLYAGVIIWVISLLTGGKD
jgi:hypothetical protein